MNSYRIYYIVWLLTETIILTFIHIVLYISFILSSLCYSE